MTRDKLLALLGTLLIGAGVLAVGWGDPRLGWAWAGAGVLAHAWAALEKPVRRHRPPVYRSGKHRADTRRQR